MYGHTPLKTFTIRSRLSLFFLLLHLSPSLPPSPSPSALANSCKQMSRKITARTVIFTKCFVRGHIAPVLKALSPVSRATSTSSTRYCKQGKHGHVDWCPMADCVNVAAPAAPTLHFGYQKPNIPRRSTPSLRGYKYQSKQIKTERLRRTTCGGSFHGAPSTSPRCKQKTV